MALFRSSSVLSRLDAATGVLLVAMVVFSPWAFGTTQEWSRWVMNYLGYATGLLLVLKWVLRWTSKRPALEWGATGQDQEASPAASMPSSWMVRLLAAGTILILGFTLTSALNARAVFLDSGDFGVFDYQDHLPWLPHTYDRWKTWRIFWQTLALAAVFWATRDWLLTQSPGERAAVQADKGARALRRGFYVPQKLRLLLWVLALNGVLLAAEGLIQRAMGSSELLWLVQPRINRAPEAQFGPYAYRSNAAQYFLLVWPVALGFWYLLRGRAQYGLSRFKAHNLVLSCVVLIALAPLMTLSRAGAIIGTATFAIAFALLAWRDRNLETAMKWRVGSLLGIGFLLGGATEWSRLTQRFTEHSIDSGRLDIWQRAWEMARDYPLFGAGPGAFEALFMMYRGSIEEKWPAYVHNDWLELLVGYGFSGSFLVLGTLALVFARAFQPHGVPVDPIFRRLLILSLGTCLAFAFVDLPFQVYSIAFLFVLLAAILSTFQATTNRGESAGIREGGHSIST